MTIARVRPPDTGASPTLLKSEVLRTVSSTIGLAISVARAFAAPLVRNSNSTWTGCGDRVARSSSGRTLGRAGSMYEFMDKHPESDAASAPGRRSVLAAASLDSMVTPFLLWPALYTAPRGPVNAQRHASGRLDKAEQRLQARRAHGAREEEALRLLAAQGVEKCELVLALHALGDHEEAQRVRHLHDGAHDHR